MPQTESMRLPSFTLDTNCVLAVDEQRPESGHVFELVRAHREGRAHVSLVAISASERQRNGEGLERFDAFTDRVNALGFEGVPLVRPIWYWDVTFWDCTVSEGAADEALERRIHEALFPNIEFLWADYCAARGLDPDAPAKDQKWRNAKCDVQAMWSHVHARRDVFVTSDMNFHVSGKRERLIDVGAGRIETPQGAVAFLETRAKG